MELLVLKSNMETPQPSECSRHEYNTFIELADKKMTDGEDYLFGQSETEIVENEESYLPHQKLLNSCKKNPGHDHFIPAHIFNIQHLPEGQRDVDLLNLIKATSDLTIRLKVGMISPKRPEFWPETNLPYPFFTMRGLKKLRTGTGRVWNILKHNSIEDNRDKDGNERTCPCQQCKNSDSPSKIWWHMDILTATHVVFDATEAKNTTCTLFYDTETSPQINLQAVGVSPFSTDVKADFCDIICVTCDKGLAKKLSQYVKKFDLLWDKVFEKFQDSDKVGNLVFIVSHPHGGPKSVTIGNWLEKFPVGKSQDYKFTYTTSTCPGSSGALVVTVGFSWWTQQFHSGTLRSGLNFSTASSIWK